jgi:hypothetical protein
MNESWPHSQRAHTEQVGMDRLRTVKHEWEDEQKRRPNDLNFPVSIEYHDQFNFTSAAPACC